MTPRPLTAEEEVLYRTITDLLPNQARRVWATLDAARAAIPDAEGLRERIAAAIPTYTFIKPDHYAATDAIPLSQVVEDVIAALASTPEAE